jgi:hypothetical protein
MKRIIFVLLIALVAVSCNQKEKKQIVLLTQQVDSLKKQGFEKDSAINEFFRVINEIESNLAIIKEREKIIANASSSTTEIKDDSRERINNDILLINELMEKNRKSIRYLNKQLKESNIKIVELEERLVQTTKLLEERDQEIVVLKENLTKLNFDIATLNAAVDTLSVAKQALTKEVETKTEMLNTAFFAIGSKKELVDNKVIDKTGGFLGMGKTTRLKSDFNETYFSKVDVTKTNSIPLYGKKAVIITTHPAETYKMVISQEGVVERIEILDAQKFWSASKYLVVQIEQ